MGYFLPYLLGLHGGWHCKLGGFVSYRLNITVGYRRIKCVFYCSFDSLANTVTQHAINIRVVYQSERSYIRFVGLHGHYNTGQFDSMVISCTTVTALPTAAAVTASFLILST